MSSNRWRHPCLPRRPDAVILLLLLAAFASALPAQILTSSATLSGSGTDAATAIAADPQGNVFVAGTTTSTDFPIVNGLVSSITQTALQTSPDGQTFSPSSLPAANITAFAASADGNTLLAASSGAIYRSADAGAAWTALPNALPGTVVALAIDPTNASNAYAIANLDASAIFYSSADGGSTWQSSGVPGNTPGGIGITRIFIDPQNPTSIYAFFAFGLYHSSDSGKNWQLYALPGASVPGEPFTPVDFALAPSQPQTLYAVLASGVTEKSSDGGATWQTIANMDPATLNALAVDPQNPNVVWFADLNGVQRSSDGGATVQTVTSFNGAGNDGIAIAIDPRNSSHIFVLTAISQLYASFDDGATWNVVAGGSIANVLATPLGVYATGAVPPTLFLAKLDPTLSHVLFSTFLGPANPGSIALALDASGNPLVAGFTQSPGFPIVISSLAPIPTGPTGFAIKLRADGSAVLYSTFLDFTPSSAAVDSNGNAVIAGTALPGAPVTQNAYQRVASSVCPRPGFALLYMQPAQPGHAFIEKLGPDLSVSYATYLSGSCGDTAQSVALDAAGNAYLTGYTYSQDFPLTTNAFDSSFPDATLTNAFVSELSPDGSHLLYSSFVGGGENSSGNAIALDAGGNVYVAGATQATASPGALADPNPNGCQFQINIGPARDESYEYTHGFIARLALNGAPPAFLATIGGSCQDSVHSLSIDGGGNLWLAGTTASADFPYVAPIGAFGVGAGGFVAEVNPSGSQIFFASPTGGYNNLTPALAAARTGAFAATAIAPPSKSGATAALAAFIDENQSPPLDLDSIATPSLLPPIFEPFFIPAAIAPGQLIYLNGANLGPTAQVNAQLTPAGLFPTQLAGVQVFFNGIAAPLVSVAANQIECQAPFEIAAASPAAIQVQSNGQTSNAFAAAVISQQPSLLAVANADGTANSASNPAPAGSVVALYLTGLGQTTPASLDGALNASTATVPNMLPTVSVNGQNVQPAYFGAAVGESTGVTQMNLTLPQTPGGPYASVFIFVNNGLPEPGISLQIYFK